MERPIVNVVIPVYNEERILAASIYKLNAFLHRNCPHPYEIVVAENGSTDRTLEIAFGLQRQYSRLKVQHISQKGRGGAIKEVWREGRADVLSYMDVDLSTDLESFLPLIEPLLAGDSDLVVGSRLLNPDL